MAGYRCFAAALSLSLFSAKQDCLAVCQSASRPLVSGDSVLQLGPTSASFSIGMGALARRSDY